MRRSLLLPRLDYCNIVLSRLPQSTISTLQHVFNTAARLVLGHTAQTLKQLQLRHQVQGLFAGGGGTDWPVSAMSDGHRGRL